MKVLKEKTEYKEYDFPYVPGKIVEDAKNKQFNAEFNPDDPIVSKRWITWISIGFMITLVLLAVTFLTINYWPAIVKALYKVARTVDKMPLYVQSIGVLFVIFVITVSGLVVYSGKKARV